MSTITKLLSWSTKATSWIFDSSMPHPTRTGCLISWTPSPGVYPLSAKRVSRRCAWKWWVLIQARVDSHGHAARFAELLHQGRTRREFFRWGNNITSHSISWLHRAQENHQKQDFGCWKNGASLCLAAVSSLLFMVRLWVFIHTPWQWGVRKGLWT